MSTDAPEWRDASSPPFPRRWLRVELRDGRRVELRRAPHAHGFDAERGWFDAEYEIIIWNAGTAGVPMSRGGTSFAGKTLHECFSKHRTNPHPPLVVSFVETSREGHK